jgi:hypothetical protein
VKIHRVAAGVTAVAALRFTATIECNNVRGPAGRLVLGLGSDRARRRGTCAIAPPFEDEVVRPRLHPRNGAPLRAGEAFTTWLAGGTAL